MARPSSNVIVVCNNVAQAGRIAQSLGARRGHHEPGHHHDRSSPRSTRQGQKGAGHHHHDLTGPHSTTGTLGQARGSTTGAHRSTGTHNSTGTHSSNGMRRAPAVRLWKVFHGVTKYEVQAVGTRLEARSEDDGSTVWRGVRLSNGQGYATESTTLVAEQLESFLSKVRDGDQTTPGAQEMSPSAHRAAPASAHHAVQHPSTARARRTTQKPATAARPEAPRDERSASTATKPTKPTAPKHPASATPKSKVSANTKPKSKASANATPKSKASANTKPKSKAPANTKPKSKRAASPSQRPASKAKATAKRHPAAKATTSGPATSRSPGSPHVTPASMRQRLYARDPSTPEAALATWEAVWRGGASEPTRAWMIANGIPDLVEAFIDWVEHHKKAAGKYMEAGNAKRAA